MAWFVFIERADNGLEFYSSLHILRNKLPVIWAVVP